MADQLQLMLEAERRGILPLDKVALLSEARKRGLVPSAEGVPVGRQALISQIPVEPGANVTPTIEPKPSLLGELRGGLETIPALASGAVSGVVAPIVGLAGSVLQGKGPQEGERIAREVSQSMTYQPRTAEARRNVAAIGNALAPLVGVPIPTLNALAESSPAALRAISDAARSEAGLIGETVQAPLAARQARIAAERSTKSWARAPQIEAAQLAPKYDIALDPAQSNPTTSNRVKAALSGASDLDVKLSTRNETKWVDAAKDAMGLPTESVLNKEAYGIARSRPEIANPYNAAKNIPVVEVPDATYSALDSLRVQPLYGDTGQAAAINGFIDNVKTQLSEGGNGAKFLKSAQQLRQEAQSIYHSEKAGHPITPEMRVLADAKMGAADALELAISENIPNPNARQAFNNARTLMAQTHDFEAATNFATGKLDPQVLAKMAEEGKPLTGVVGDLAKIAANFPETSKIGAMSDLRPRLTRTGVSGTIGGVVGNMLAPGVGWVPGTAVGAGVGYLSSGIGAKRIASPAYQKAHAVPTDYRLNNLAPPP